MSHDGADFHDNDRYQDDRPSMSLEERFPDMTPIQSPPSLFTINGVGLSVVGARDHDVETDTYVKTHCICLIFVPIIALSAYRVLKAPGSQGWYFIGREPLSPFAKVWNFGLIFSIAAAIAAGTWISHLNSPEHQAKVKLAEAEQKIAEGDLLQASRLLKEVKQTKANFVREAAAAFTKLLAAPQMTELSPRDAQRVLETAIDVQGGADTATTDLAIKLAEQHAPADPLTAVRILKTVSRHQQPKTSEALAQLLAGPLKELPPQQTVDIFHVIAGTWSNAANRDTLFDDAARRIAALQNSDLPAAINLLKTVAPLATPPQVAAVRDSLLAAPLDAASVAAAREAMAVAWELTPVDERPALAQRGLDWLDNHPDADSQQAGALLAVFQDLPPDMQQKVTAAHREILEKIVVAHPDDLNAAAELGLLLETEGKSARIVELLMPHRQKLGDTEAARVLGEALAGEGQFDESYALLQPYVESRLTAFHNAEAAYNQEVETFQQATIASLQLGFAPGFDFQAIEKMDEEQQGQVLRDYMVQRIEQNEELQRLMTAFQEQAAIVPVALNLGIVTLRRAQEMSDSAAQRAELEKAERTFLAVQGVAGDSEEFQLFLGQVYYWLGKHEQGHELFDKYLAGQDRNFVSLIAIAQILREVGEHQGARVMLEEAYEKAADDEQKQTAAMMRAAASKETDDRITWLGRAKQNTPEAQASLADAEGDQALERGDRDLAVRKYREAIRHYQLAPESPARANNMALTYFSLFSANGDRDALQKGIDNIEKSISLDPDNGIVLVNAANSLLSVAIQDLAGDDVDLQELEMPWAVDVFCARTNDVQEVEEYRQKVRTHAGIKQGLEYAQRAIVLAPKNYGTYAIVARIQSTIRDLEGLRQTRRQFQSADVDTKILVDLMLEEIQPPGAEKMAEWARRSGAMRNLLVTYRSQNHGPAFTLALSRLVDLTGNSPLPVTKADCDQLVLDAEEGAATYPSLSSKSTLFNALLLRAHTELKDANPQYGTLAKDAHHILPPQHVVALAASRPDVFGDTIHQHADVVRAVDIAVEQMERFPETQSPVKWALVKTTHPDLAARMADFLNQDEYTQLTVDFYTDMNPASAAHAYNAYWLKLAAGDQAAAEAILKRTSDLGIPLPQLSTATAAR